MVAAAENSGSKSGAPVSLIGKSVGGSYTITKFLAEGGMGAVYLASSSLLAGKLAAVKVLSAECTEDEASMNRFLAELFVTGKLQDPNIVKVFDAGRFPDGRMYMLMEYCAGGSLDELLARKGALPFDEIVNLIGPVASVLDEAHHEAKITHRDIKPANVLLVQEPGGPLRARLGDFGIAKLHLDRLHGHKETMQLLGSPGYFSPEQGDTKRGSGNVDHRSDVYALASMLYEMVTGQRPYPAGNVYQLIEAVARNQPIVLPRILRSDLPKECEEVIMEGLAHDREVRVQTVKELVTRFAAGIPNGTALLAYAAPRLVRSTAEPTAKTISGALGPAAIQWSAAVDASARAASARAISTARMPRKMQWVMLLAAAIGCLSVGVLIGRMRRASAPAQASGAFIVDAPSVAVSPQQPNVIAATKPAVPDAPVLDAPVLDASPPDAPAPMRAIDAPTKAAVATPDAPPVSVKPAPKPAVATMGVLAVNVTPFAEVAIDGVAIGSTPLRHKLTVGVHRVTLAGPNERTETVVVNINGAKPTTIARKW
ncbi:MAG TPA: protein kinase [Kofleriaceae bacterium]|nr:protein kinase [Kofleriaceae bacterium]